MHTLLFPLVTMLCCTTGDFDMLVDHLRESDIRRIAVLPEAFCLDSNDKPVFSCDAPQSRELARRIRCGLIELLDETHLVLPQETLDQDVARWSNRELGSQDSYTKLAGKHNAGILAVFGKIKRFGELELDLRLYTENGLEARARENMHMTLSDFAYSGMNFEIRRWKSPELKIVGFHEKTDRVSMLGVGPNYEAVQAYKMMRNAKDSKHVNFVCPLENKDLALQTSFLVDGESRELVEHDGQYYLLLEVGEHFEILVQQDMDKSILLAIYIDGRNSLGKMVEHPRVTPVNRMWKLSHGKQGCFSGWHVRHSRDRVTKQDFVIQERGVKEGSPRRIGNRIGMITIIGYTNGLEDIAGIPEKDIQAFGTKLSVGAGDTKETKLTRVAAKKGLMLFAATVRYCTEEEFKKLKKDRRAKPLAISNLPDK